MSFGWAGAIIALIGLITGIYKYFIDPRRKAKRKVVEDAKEALDNRDRSKLHAMFSRLSRKHK